MSLVRVKANKLISIVLALALILSLLAFSPDSGIQVLAADTETLNRSDVTLFIGDDVYSANKTYLEVLSGNTVTKWESSDVSVATVSASGKVTAVGVGTATITAQTSTGTASCSVIVGTLPDEIEYAEAPAAQKPVNTSGWGGGTYPLNDSVHDPEILYVESEDTYYLICTHQRSFRTSKDLITWTNSQALTAGFSDTADAFVKDAGKFASVGFWAPDIFWNPVMGKYCLYYSVSNTLNDGGRGFGNKASAIGLTVLEPVNGVEYSIGTTDNWEDRGIVVKSYDAWKRDGYIQNGSGSFKFGADNAASAETAPNAIDPEIYFDAEGERLYMVYGSFFAGIYVLELDPETGLPFDQMSLDPEDEKYEARKAPGVLVANRGGSYAFAEPLDQRRKVQSGIEGPTTFYNPDTGYYYLMVSYDYLDGTYNVRVGRSKSPTGPFKDYNGFDMVSYTEENVELGLNPDYIFSNETINTDPGFQENAALGENDGMLVEETLSYDPNVGTRILSPYRFEGGQNWVATGHNSVFTDKNGNLVIGSHAKNPQALHVRNILWSEDGWPLASPARYAGEDLEQPIDASRMVNDNYELIIFPRVLGTTTNAYCLVGVKCSLNADGTVTSDNAQYTGTWRMYEANKIDLILDGVSYHGTVTVGWDWDDWGDTDYVFSAISESHGVSETDGVMLWGKGGQANTFTEIIEPVEAPYATPAGGAVESGTVVSLHSDTEGAQIYYTLDGNEPTESSTLYEVPITITQATTIKARAYKDGLPESEVTRERYTIQTTDPTVPSTPGSSTGTPAIPPVTIKGDSDVHIEIRKSQLPTGIGTEDVSLNVQLQAPESTPVQSVTAALAANKNLPAVRSISAYDLNLLLKNGKAVDFKGKIKVSLPRGEMGNHLRVFHVAENGTMTEVYAVINGNEIEFEVEHFSYYAVVDFTSYAGAFPITFQAEGATTTVDVKPAETTTETVTPGDGPEKNPKTSATAIPMGLMLLVSAGTTGVVICRKRK